jgi:hypothetical protein
MATLERIVEGPLMDEQMLALAHDPPGLESRLAPPAHGPNAQFKKSRRLAMNRPNRRHALSYASPLVLSVAHNFQSDERPTRGAKVCISCGSFFNSPPLFR